MCSTVLISHYKVVTEPFQEMDPEQAAPLFLSYVKPHKPVTLQWLAHWIKDLLKEAGVDTEVFKAHSVRGLEPPPQQF